MTSQGSACCSTDGSPETEGDSKKSATEYKNNPHIVMAFKLYEKAVGLQVLGEIRLALEYYQALVSLIATDPYIWLRMAECGLHILYKDYQIWSNAEKIKSTPFWVDSGSKNGFYLMNGSTLTENDPGISLSVVESYINTAMILLMSSQDKELRMKVVTLAAFIALKRGRFGAAVAHVNEVFLVEDEISNELKFQAFVIKMECYLNQGNFKDILNSLESSAEYLTKHEKWDIWRVKCFTLVGAFEEAVQLIRENKDLFNSRDIPIISAYLYLKTKRESEFLELLST